MKDAEIVVPVVVGTVAFFLGKKVDYFFGQKRWCCCKLSVCVYKWMVAAFSQNDAFAGYRNLYAQVDSLCQRTKRRGYVTCHQEGAGGNVIVEEAWKAIAFCLRGFLQQLLANACFFQFDLRLYNCAGGFQVASQLCKPYPGSGGATLRSLRNRVGRVWNPDWGEDRPCCWKVSDAVWLRRPLSTCSSHRPENSPLGIVCLFCRYFSAMTREKSRLRFSTSCDCMKPINL